MNLYHVKLNHAINSAQMAKKFYLILVTCISRSGMGYAKWTSSCDMVLISYLHIKQSCQLEASVVLIFPGNKEFWNLSCRHRCERKLDLIFC